MGTKLQQTVIDSSKAEIDTRAPFESVKAAVSLFGEVAFTSDKLTVRKPKPPPIEVYFLLLFYLDTNFILNSILTS